MRTRTAIVEFSAEDKAVKFFGGKKEGEKVELYMSPARALSIYMVLMGRRPGTKVSRVYRDTGEEVKLWVFESENESGKEKRIVAKKGDETVLNILLRSGGALALSEEVAEAIRRTLGNGAVLELGEDGLFILALSGRITVLYDGSKVVLRKPVITVLKKALLTGNPIDGNVSFDGKRLYIEGKVIEDNQKELLRSVIEVLG